MGGCVSSGPEALGPGGWEGDLESAGDGADCVVVFAVGGVERDDGEVDGNGVVDGPVTNS
jgi:hypothetical protein